MTSDASYLGSVIPEMIDGLKIRGTTLAPPRPGTWPNCSSRRSHFVNLGTDPAPVRTERQRAASATSALPRVPGRFDRLDHQPLVRPS
jgi:hypothetical protein